MRTTRGGSAELFEREHDLAAIDAGIEAAKAGRGSLLVVKGEAGIGKTALLAAARERAADTGLEVLSAGGGELERGLAFGVVRQLFERRVAGAEEAERGSLLAGAAGLAVPVIGLDSNGPAAREHGAADATMALQHGLYWLCANLAEQRPLLLTVDDLHWADESSARWLLYLVRRAEGLPILVLAATRAGEPGSDPQLLAALEAEPLGETVEPALLSLEASAGLLRAQLGAQAEDEFCEACHRLSGGNPFLLHALVTAVEEDVLAPTAESAAEVGRLGSEAISRSILLRLARLPEAALPLVRAVAVLGAETELRHASALARLDEESAAAATDALTTASVLASGRPLAFTHPLLRTAVYQDIPKAERSLAHGRGARLLADEGADPERVAGHLLETEPAGDEWVVERLERAADSALGRGVPAVGITYLRRALEEPASTSARPRLLRMLVAATTSVSDWSALEAVSDDPLAELSAEPEALRESVIDLIRWLFSTGQGERVPEVTEMVVAIATKTGDHELAWKAEAGLLSAYEVRIAEALERVGRYEGRLEPGSGLHKAWLALGAWFMHFQPGIGALPCAERAREALDGDELLASFPDAPFFPQAVLLLLRADELDDAEYHIDRFFDDASRRGSIADFIAATGLRSQLALRRDNIGTALEDARTAHKLVVTHGLVISLPAITIWLLEALVEAGELEEAEQVLSASRMSGPIPAHYWFTPVLLPRARARAAQGQREEALGDLRQLARSVEATSGASTYPATFPIASETALLLAAEGDQEAAERLAEQELSAAAAWGTPRGLGIARRALGLIRGGDEGIELLREAVDTLRASPSKLELARALTDLGAALRRAKRRSEAREVLGEALELAHRCEAAPLEARAREELSATGARPRRIVRTGVDSLTPSELRVARMAAEGMENKEIAQALFVTVKTIETHLGHVYGKLELSSRKRLPQALAAPTDAG